MKAVVLTNYGGPDKLELRDVPKPVPSDNEVLIRVHAVSINDWDWALMYGDFMNRVMNGFTVPKIKILGSDIAGVVESVGKSVTKFKTGDEVFGDLSGKWGGFAEYVCANEKSLGRKSPKMTFEQAAAIPQAAMLAVQGLIDKGGIKAGQQILLNGAGGGVGTFGIQLLKPFGVEITAVDSGAKLEMLRGLGVAKVMDYQKEDFIKSGNQYDLILDVKTNRSTFDYLRVLKPEGRYLTVGGSLSKLLKLFLWSFIIKPFTKKRVGVVALKTNKDLDLMTKLFEEGKVKPIIDGNFTLEQTAEAFRHFEKAAHKGKLVVSVN